MSPQCWQDQQYSRLQLVARLEGLWEQIQKARRSYNQATEKKRVEFEELKKKCQERSREIDVQAKKLRKLQVWALNGSGIGVADSFSVEPWGLLGLEKPLRATKSDLALAKSLG